MAFKLLSTFTEKVHHRSFKGSYIPSAIIWIAKAYETCKAYVFIYVTSFRIYLHVHFEDYGVYWKVFLSNCVLLLLSKLCIHHLKRFRWIYVWDKIFKKGPSKICGRQPLKNLEDYGPWRTPSNFLKAVFHNFYLLHSWIHCPIDPWFVFK